MSSRLVASPACVPKLGLDQCLERYSSMGYTRFEAFTEWTNSAVTHDDDPAAVRALADKSGMSFYSFHLPRISAAVKESTEQAIEYANLAKHLGAEIVLLKAASRALYVRAAPQILDAVEDLGLTAVLQNHANSPISSLEDYEQVLDGIDDDRMRALLEVGHFHDVGVTWDQACSVLDGRIALVHLKDKVGRSSVPYGYGDIDLPKLFEHLRNTGYHGNYVLELEGWDEETTLRWLTDARRYVADGLGDS